MVNNTPHVSENVLYLVVYILFYLTMLTVAQPVHHHMMGGLVNNELEMMLEETVIT